MTTTNTNGTGSLAKVSIGRQGIELQNMDDAWRFSQAVCAAGMAPVVGKGGQRMDPGQVMIAIQLGAEIGLPPMTALKNIAVFNGRPTIWGDALLALVERNGLLERIDETIDGTGDDRTAWCRVRRKGRSYDTVRTFSVANAKQAGLWGKAGPWQAYPDRMLQMRARGFALRDTFPDALGGFMLAEEARDIDVQVEDGPPASGQEALLAHLRPPAETTDAPVEQGDIGLSAEDIERLRATVDGGDA